MTAETEQKNYSDNAAEDNFQFEGVTNDRFHCLVKSEAIIEKQKSGTNENLSSHATILQRTNNLIFLDPNIFFLLNRHIAYTWQHEQ